MKTPSPVNSISGDLERAASEKAREGARLYASLQQGAGNLNIKRLLLIKENQISCMKRFSALLCMGRHTRLTEIISFLCISAIWGQILLFDCSHPNSLFTERDGRCGRNLRSPQVLGTYQRGSSQISGFVSPLFASGKVLFTSTV